MIRRASIGLAAGTGLALSAASAADDPDFPDACEEAVLVAVPAEVPRATEGEALVLNEMTYRLEETGGVIETFLLRKIRDPETGAVYREVLDGRRREVDDLEDRIDAARTWRRAILGVIDARLTSLLDDRRADDAWRRARPELPVMIGFVVEPSRRPRSFPLTEPEKRRLAEAARERHRRQEDRIAERMSAWLGAERWKQVRKSQHGPFVSAVLRDEEIGLLDEINRRSETGLIMRIRHAPVGAVRDTGAAYSGLALRINESRSLTMTDVVHDEGFDGSGVRIAFLEVGYPSKMASFNLVNYMEIGTDEDHLMKGLSIVGHTASFKRADGTTVTETHGYAPGAELLLANADANANGQNDDYVDQSKWAMDGDESDWPDQLVDDDRQASVLVMPWHLPGETSTGLLTPRDVHFDWIANEPPFPVVIASAGAGGSYLDHACARGYNVLSVADVNNEPLSGRCDSTINCASSWVNPDDQEDRQVPQIAAPGTGYTIQAVDTHAGTSAATAALAGIVALLHEVDPALVGFPWAVRAILLAGATEQSADGAPWAASWNHDGAGLVNTLYSTRIAQSRLETMPPYRGYDVGEIDDSDFDDKGLLSKEGPDGEKVPWTWTVETCTGSCRVRVALCWTSTADGASTQLDADLDLYVVDDGGHDVAVPSTSWTSSNELVVFTPPSPTGGSYTIQVRSGSFKLGAEPAVPFTTSFAVAWTAEYDLCP